MIYPVTPYPGAYPTKREPVISDADRSAIAETTRRELRIEFAKAALTGLLAAGDDHDFNRAEIAAEAWRQADAMLAMEGKP